MRRVKSEIHYLLSLQSEEDYYGRVIISLGGREAFQLV